MRQKTHPDNSGALRKRGIDHSEAYIGGYGRDDLRRHGQDQVHDLLVLPRSWHVDPAAILNRLVSTVESSSFKQIRLTWATDTGRLPLGSVDRRSE